MENENTWIRVSCASLCRIEHENRFLLILNAKKKKKGTYMLAPIGGGVELFDKDRIREWGIDCYRHDANIAPLEFWRAADAPDRQG